MGKIPFPPGRKTKAPVRECFAFNEPLILELKTSGYLKHDNPLAFAPNLPTGNFVDPLDLGPYYAVPNERSITLKFFDTANGEEYTTIIDIKPEPCPGRERD
jgi:hypothetical protein